MTNEVIKKIAEVTQIVPLLLTNMVSIKYAPELASLVLPLQTGSYIVLIIRLTCSRT